MTLSEGTRIWKSENQICQRCNCCTEEFLHECVSSNFLSTCASKTLFTPGGGGCLSSKKRFICQGEINISTPESLFTAESSSAAARAATHKDNARKREGGKVFLVRLTDICSSSSTDSIQQQHSPFSVLGRPPQQQPPPLSVFTYWSETVVSPAHRLAS